MSTSTSLKPRPLFGGAIDLSLPSDFLDASDLRQIPDNQEVFLSPSSDTTAILEVLGMVEEGAARDDLWEAAKYHFSSIAHDNASLSSTILTPGPGPAASPKSLATPFPPPPSTGTGAANIPTPLPTILAGTQTIHKFSHDPSGAPRPGHETDQPDQVWIGVALWRIWLEDKAAGRTKKADLVLSVNVNLSAKGGERERKSVEEWFPHAVASLTIQDHNLFGDE